MTNLFEYTWANLLRVATVFPGVVNINAKQGWDDSCVNHIAGHFTHSRHHIPLRKMKQTNILHG
jgi:hypothetical protein